MSNLTHAGKKIGMNSKPKFSIVITYFGPPESLRLALQSLAEQTLIRADFEVVIGVMECNDEYLAICREFADRLIIVSVSSARSQRVSYARNLAIRQAAGDVLVLMDGDLALSSRSLDVLYCRHFVHRQSVCMVGQMINCDNDTGGVTEVFVKPYEDYRKVLNDVAARGCVDADPRLRTQPVIPWPYPWIALVALPRALVATRDLWFDPTSQCYGVEDLEWAYRVRRASVPILMSRDFFGLRLPHVRDVAANKRTETVNYRNFLERWPGYDVEKACTLGGLAANEAYLAFQEEFTRPVEIPDTRLSVSHARVDGVEYSHGRPDNHG
jgi:glycosyltransferase involved in cell wall biosynthesis